MLRALLGDVLRCSQCSECLSCTPRCSAERRQPPQGFPAHGLWCDGLKCPCIAGHTVHPTQRGTGRSGLPWYGLSFPQGASFWGKGAGVWVPSPFGSAGAGTWTRAEGWPCSPARARCFPDVTHFLSGSSVFSFLCTCLFWTTNKIKKGFYNPVPRRLRVQDII